MTRPRANLGHLFRVEIAASRHSQSEVDYG